MLGDVRLARNETTAVTCHVILTKSSHDYTVYIYSVRRETGRDQGVKVPDH